MPHESNLNAQFIVQYQHDQRLPREIRDGQQWNKAKYILKYKILNTQIQKYWIQYNPVSTQMRVECVTWSGEFAFWDEFMGKIPGGE